MAVVGGRNYTNRGRMWSVLDRYRNRYGISWLTSGGAVGADALGVEWAISRQLFGYTVYLAQWEQYGKRAGYRRNLLIVENSDVVFAFPDPTSKGTWHTVKLAKRMDVPCFVCDPLTNMLSRYS